MNSRQMTDLTDDYYEVRIVKFVVDHSYHLLYMLYSFVFPIPNPSREEPSLYSKRA